MTLASRQGGGICPGRQRDAAHQTAPVAAALVIGLITLDLLAAYRERGFDERQAVAWAAAVQGDGYQGLDEAVRWAELGLSPE